jgi:ribosomal protein S18 acetylase RimI-like enzyme
VDLRAIDTYLDTVPRSVARTETIGQFTLFLNEGHGWRYYARPTPEGPPVRQEDVARVRERQRTLGQPEAIEWIQELTPEVGAAASGSGMQVRIHPLMCLEVEAFVPLDPPEGIEVAVVGPGSDLAALHAVAEIAFGSPGTAVGASDVGAVEAAERSADQDTIAFTRERIRAGFTVMAGAWSGGRVVASGSYQPVEGDAEITGIATLPDMRRRGIGGALTSTLAGHALGAGVRDLFLSADDEDVARVYARLGFTRAGSIGAASAPAG